MKIIFTIDKMAEIYIKNLGFKKAYIEVQQMIGRITSQEGKLHWGKVLVRIREKVEGL